jgi:tungstate transport system permease protein
MDSFRYGFVSAFHLIFNLDPELLDIIFLSLEVSFVGLVIACIVGLPVGAVVALKNFRGRGFVISILNTLMGVPPVVVGLFLYLALSRSGPLGVMGLLYTPSAMIIAQTIIALPIVAALCHSAVVDVRPIIGQAATTLGATPFQTTVTVMREARYGIISAVVAGFGRAMAEVGAVLIVGGNIAHYTRIMTTAIALETDKGNFELALALGIILLGVSLVINVVFHLFQRRGVVGPVL